MLDADDGQGSGRLEATSAPWRAAHVPQSAPLKAPARFHQHLRSQAACLKKKLKKEEVEEEEEEKTTSALLLCFSPIHRCRLKKKKKKKKNSHIAGVSDLPP